MGLFLRYRWRKVGQAIMRRRVKGADESDREGKEGGKRESTVL